MKKSLILAALVLMSTVCFAQKNPLVKKAKNLILQENPDFALARATMDEALKGEPTAEIYYWAGMIGYQELAQENMNQLYGKGFSQAKAGAAVEESYNYWLQADELAMKMVLNKKGVEVPADPKTHNNITKRILEYYKAQELVKYAGFLDEQKDVLGAYQALKIHVGIPDLPMMQDPKLQKEMPRDTTYTLFKYYTAVYAVQAELHDEAIARLEELKDGDREPVLVNQFLYQEYVAVKDTVKFIETLQNAIQRFPGEPWFLQNLINYYIFSGQEKTAIEYLEKAIEREPTVAQYHLIKGNLDENQGNYETALADFDRALELDPTMADAMAGKGRVYYNQAAKLNEAAADITDNKAYKKALEEMNAVFRQSLPYFEKAHEMAPEDRTYMQILKGLYYRFGMDAEYAAMSEKLNNL